MRHSFASVGESLGDATGSQSDSPIAGLHCTPMSDFTYILGSETPAGWRTYVGWTTDLDARLAAHNAGTGAKSTRGRSWVLLYAERYKTRGEAMRREWHLKRDRRFRKLVLPTHMPTSISP